MKVLRFYLVDVFSSRPMYGNPVGVILEGQLLTTDEMRRIAMWTGLPETTFILPPTSPSAHYLLRIFNARNELLFAGHPVIGSAYAILDSNLIAPSTNGFVQDSSLGHIHISVKKGLTNPIIFTEVPTPNVEPLPKDQLESLAECFGLYLQHEYPPLKITVGVSWLVVPLKSASFVSSIVPNLSAIQSISADMGVYGVTIFGLTGAYDPALLVRSFAPLQGVSEDPVCGSGNAAVGAFLCHYSLLSNVGENYVASQGASVGRDGRVQVIVRSSDGRILIGGECNTCMKGQIIL